MLVDYRWAYRRTLRAESALQGLNSVVEFTVAVLGGRELGPQALNGYPVRGPCTFVRFSLASRGVDEGSQVLVALQEVSVNAGACDDNSPADASVFTLEFSERGKYSCAHAIAASSLVRPSAIFPQKARSRSLRTGGRPGERITARPVNAAAHPGGRPIENTSIVEVLRPPVEPGQYTSRDFAKLCTDLGVIQSMGAVGTSADNALAESFNAALKREVLQDNSCWADAVTCRREVFRWLARYNTKRRHSHCRYVSPANYERNHTPATLPETA